MTFQQYISHPARTEDGEPTLLIGSDGRFDADGHLKTVADRMDEACCGQSLSDGTPAQPVANIIGLTHDFAKLTRWAQKHLRGQPFKKEKRYRYHSFTSSLVTLYCAQASQDIASDHAAEIATLVVAGHHDVQSPPDPSEAAARYGRKDATQTYQRVGEQITDIDTHASRQADRTIQEATDTAGSWNDFLTWHNSRTEPIDGFHEHIMYFARMEERDEGEGYYTDVVRLWTSLKFADQTAASGLANTDIDGSLPNRTALDTHVESLDDGQGVLAEFNSLRDQARTTVTENIEGLVDSDDVGLITLPTGFGKTYAGLSAGLRAASLKNSRLLYVLPYTSILDQTSQEIQSIFNVSPYSKAFTLHHHLSDTYTGLGNRYTDADIGRSPGALHAESWLSGLTLTTTVQLFESITAPTARQATRIPSLHQAVVVIDEPQAIPDDWWQIVPLLVELLVEKYDATVVLMTATQPGLLKYGSDKVEVQELTDDTDQYRDFLSTHPRVTYRLHDTILAKDNDYETLDYPTAGRQVFAAVENGQDALAICNTRASARELYQNVMSGTDAKETLELGRLLHDYVTDSGSLPTVAELRRLAIDAVDDRNASTIYAFLSGDVRPNDRALIIDTLCDNEAGDDGSPGPLLDTDAPVVLVSTSVVEAGVDLSFDTVFRDYAPIPNIVQSGGRCNRAFDGDNGEVVVWRLASSPDSGYIPSLVIHGGDGGDALPLLQGTSRVLHRYAADDGTIPESVMIDDAVSDFYDSLFNGALEPGDKALAEAVSSANMSELEGERMIDDIDAYEDIVVGLTDSERDELFTGEPDVASLSEFAGAQVNTDAGAWTQEVTEGKSRYLLLDGRSDLYHPVFGVQSERN